MKISKFYSSGEPESEEILDGSPALASHRSDHFLGLLGPFSAIPRPWTWKRVIFAKNL